MTTHASNFSGRHPQFFSFMSPLSKLSSLQRLNRDYFFPIVEKTSLFTCIPSSNNQWRPLLQLLCSVATIERVRETRNKTVHNSILSIWDIDCLVVQQLGGANTRFFSSSEVCIDSPQVASFQTGGSSSIRALFSKLTPIPFWF